MHTTQTFTYKVIDGCEIKADVHREKSEKTQPVVVYLHGGGLILGSRVGSPVLIGMLVDSGYAVVSIDYRLAPETKVDGIVQDLKDAFSWIRESGPSLFNIDPSRIGVMGNSAGGYLTLLSGLVIEPSPRALSSFYGYGDIDGPWLSRPDPFYRKQPLVSESKASSTLSSRTISETPNPSDRTAFYLYCRQNGLFPIEVSGFDPAVQPSAFDAYCPVRNVTSRYPPTILLHGDADTDVPYVESVMMAKELERAGVEHQLVTMHGRGHDFEQPGFADPTVAEALDQTLAFLKKHV